MKTLELAIYGNIGESFWAEGITPKSIKAEIDGADTFSEISVRINSPGGNAFDGLAIYNLLRAQGVPVNVAVDGIAASAASIIAMAGDKIVMGKGSMMMIHDPWIMVAGNAADLRTQADTLDAVSDSMAEVYLDRVKSTKDEVRAIMAATTWMTAKEAVEKGFATDQAEGADAKALAAARNFPLLATLKNVPEALRPSGSTEGPTGNAARTESDDASEKLARARFQIKHKRSTK